MQTKLRKKFTFNTLLSILIIKIWFCFSTLILILKSCWFLIWITILKVNFDFKFKTMSPGTPTSINKIKDAVVPRCSVEWQFFKIRKTYKKTPAMESLFTKSCWLMKIRLHRSIFPLNFEKSLRTNFNRIPPGNCFWSVSWDTST